MRNVQLLLLSFFVVLLSSCELVGGIFKAGMWTGVLAIALVVFLIIFLIFRGTRK